MSNGAHLELTETIRNYTDFYASIDHATNVGTVPPGQPSLTEL